MNREEIIYTLDQTHCKYCIIGSEPCPYFDILIKEGCDKCDMMYRLPEFFIRKEKKADWRILHETI